MDKYYIYFNNILMMAEDKDRSKRVIKNTLFLFFRLIIVLLVGLYTSRVVLSTLGVEDYGIYNIVGSVVILFSFLKNALTNATFRFLAYEQGKNDFQQLRTTFSMAVNAHLILAVIIFALCEFFGVWFLNSKLVIPVERTFAANVAYQFSIISFCIGIVKTPYHSSIIAHEKMNFYAYTSVIEVILKLLIVYLLVVFSIDKLILYSLLLLSVTIIMFAWYYIRCRQLFEECRYYRVWDATILKGMLKYSGWSVIVNAVDVFVNQSIVFFYNIFFGVVANAAMGIANQVNGHLIQFLYNFTQSYNPQIIKSYASGDKNYFMKLIFSTGKFSYYLLLFLSIPIVLNIDFILKLWLGTPPEGTSTFIILIISYSLIDAYSGPLWIGVHATGNLKKHQLLMSSIKILNIPLAYILLKLGMAAWTALALKAFLNFICSIVRPCYVKYLYGLPLRRYIQKVLLVIFGVTALILAIPLYLSSQYEYSWTRLFVTSISFFIIFIPTIYYIGMDKFERQFVNKIVKNKVLKRK